MTKCFSTLNLLHSPREDFSIDLLRRVFLLDHYTPVRCIKFVFVLVFIFRLSSRLAYCTRLRKFSDDRSVNTITSLKKEFVFVLRLP